ncbi:hypothetical protein B296_00026410 [Ensete ventricosum]|uniref:Uncharacterized protein n=1 Tax=Ensete ventricosum TaxID=4639 RepID=A0A426YS55_ENSVE|nr:hypothetical protein B296_00026410 [Ensete ventricosum]
MTYEGNEEKGQLAMARPHAKAASHCMATCKGAIDYGQGQAARCSNRPWPGRRGSSPQGQPMAPAAGAATRGQGGWAARGEAASDNPCGKGRR